MTIQADIHVALMARAEVMVADLSITAIWPRFGGDIPAGEYVKIAHLPNENRPLGFSDNIMLRQGFLVVTLVSSLGEYQSVTEERAGEIAAYFIRGWKLTANTTVVTIVAHDVKQGSAQAERWETPIFISYRSEA